MKLIKILIYVLVFYLFYPSISLTSQERTSKIQKPISSQLKTIELGSRYIKLGNTYRIAKDFELADKYLQKGLSILNKGGNSYWRAVGYENYGYFLLDQGNTADALNYFTKAKELYDKVIKQKEGSNEAIDIIIKQYSGENINSGNSQDILNLKEQKRGLSTNLYDVLQDKISDIEKRINNLKKKVEDLKKIIISTVN